MTTKTKKKNQKPIDCDIHLKYRCPSCPVEHWISLKEAKTKGYRIVCDCDTVFKVKLISKVQIVYAETETKTTAAKVETEPTVTQPEKIVQEIPIDLLEKCCKILVGYGFTKSESESLIKDCYSKNPSQDTALLIKDCLSSFGENNG